MGKLGESDREADEFSNQMSDAAIVCQKVDKIRRKIFANFWQSSQQDRGEDWSPVNLSLTSSAAGISHPHIEYFTHQGAAFGSDTTQVIGPLLMQKVPRPQLVQMTP